MTSSAHRSSRRTVPVVLLALALLVGAVGTGCSSKELALRSLILVNQERQRNGVPGLLWNDEAAAKAEAWAAYLASVGDLEHSQLTDGIVTEWRHLGENVGLGATIEAVHRGFMRSGSHRDTLLARKYRQMGVGVARAADGTVYVAQVFRG